MSTIYRIQNLVNKIQKEKYRLLLNSLDDIKNGFFTFPLFLLFQYGMDRFFSEILMIYYLITGETRIENCIKKN